MIDAVLELNGEWQAKQGRKARRGRGYRAPALICWPGVIKQNIDGETDPNSGGNVVYLSPGMRIASNRWSGFATIGIPINNDLNGLQSEPTYRLFGGVLVGF